MKGLIESLLKKKYQIIIWAIGLVVLWFIWPTYEHESKFVRENELITWEMAERTGLVILGIIWLQKLTHNYLFRDEDQEKWSKEVNQRIQNIEKDLDLLMKWAVKIDKKTLDRH